MYHEVDPLSSSWAQIKAAANKDKLICFYQKCNIQEECNDRYITNKDALMLSYFPVYRVACNNVLPLTIVQGQDAINCEQCWGSCFEKVILLVT